MPLYFGFRWSCVCKWTLMVSKGCPTKVPAHPEKITRILYWSTYEDFIYLLKINNNIFGSRQLSKKEKLKIDIFHFDSCFQSSALSVDKSFTETRQYISLYSDNIRSNPSRKLSINYGHFLRDKYVIIDWRKYRQ